MQIPFTTFKRTARAAELWAFTVLLLICVVAIRQRFQMNLVSGDSMLPTYAHGDLLIVARNLEQTEPLQRGDKVVAQLGKEQIVKRVVALPGEEVEIRAGRLFINGEIFPEPYRTLEGDLQIRPGKLSADRYALLGDNRSLAPELFVHSVVGPEQILGKVTTVIRLSSMFPVGVGSAEILN